MIYLLVGTVLAVWFAIAGVIRVLKPRLMFYVTTVPISLLLTIGAFAGTIDDYFGYEHKYSILAPSVNGFDFYKFLLMKNWALSLLVIIGAFLSYEIAKLITRHYKSRRKPKHMTTAEYMQNLPSNNLPAEKSDFDLF